MGGGGAISKIKGLLEGNLFGKINGFFNTLYLIDLNLQYS